MAFGGLVRSVDAIPVKCAGTDIGQIPVKYLVSVFGKFDPLGLVSRCIEKADLNL